MKSDTTVQLSDSNCDLVTDNGLMVMAADVGK